MISNDIKARGKLKIFLGYAPGVGKSYAMLQSAQELKENGTDVVIGYLNANIGKESLELLKGFEVLTYQKINDNNKIYSEFNLNEALERKPQVIIVDELAHSNPPLCRHNKRWQDIEELIIAGIDVYTTINVQNLESLNDIIYSIIGIKESETIPDSILNKAEKIELIDMPTSELLLRYKESNRYENDFSKKEVYYNEEKLKALRELALRKTADIVNSIVQTSKLSKDKTSIVPIKERIAVCISTSPSSAKVIRAAARMAISLKSEWIAIYVCDRRSQNLTYEARRQLRSNIKLAERLGAIVEMLHGEDKVDTITNFCKHRNITKIIIGRNIIDKKYIFNINKKDIVDKLIEKIKNIEVNIIPTSDLKRKRKLKTNDINSDRGYLSRKNIIITIIISILATAISILVYKLRIQETAILLIYLLAVLCTALNTRGYIFGIVSAFVSVFIFVFLFAAPKYKFQYYNPDYIVTLPLFIFIAVITSTLIARVKEQAEVFSKNEEATQMLYEISRSFINISGEEEIINKGITHMSQGLKKSIVYFKVIDGKLEDRYIIKKRSFKESSVSNCEEQEFEVIKWVLKNRREAGKGTDTHNKVNKYYTPIISNKKIFGIIGVCCNEELAKDELTLIDAISAQMALALDREDLVKEKEDTRLQFEREKLRSNLLRAISHDLRTPLTCIAGSSGLILESYEKLTEEMKFDLIKDIKNDSEWLIRLVENLLSMTRIESNKLTINKKMEMAEEIISESIQHIKGRLENHKLKIDIPEEILFINMDGKLIEQVIINLVDNAIKYTKSGSEILIKVYEKDKFAYFQVSDNGKGINEKDMEHIFDTFYKGTRGEADSRRGVGLGLSICNSIVAAHGGKIYVENNKSGGATFTFTLPM